MGKLFEFMDLASSIFPVPNVPFGILPRFYIPFLLHSLSTIPFCIAASLVFLPSAPADESLPLPGISANAHIGLAEGWLFRWDERDEGLSGEWWKKSSPRAGWKPISVPGVWDQPPGKVNPGTKEGIGWFARKINVPAGWEGDATILFLSAMYSSDIWIDGRYVLNHKGGFTPFMLNLGDASNLAGSDGLEIVLRVDNRLSEETIPSVKLGWNSYGGLTREVYLLCQPKSRIEKIRTQTTLSGDGDASIDISGEIAFGSPTPENSMIGATLKSGDETMARCEIKPSRGADGKHSFRTRMQLKSPRLWSTEDPFLHQLEISGSDGRMLSMPLGIREIRLEGRKFLLNGNEHWLQGFGQHEDIKDGGPCIQADFLEAELRRMKEFGANHIRTGHYPHHPRTYAVCDRIGLMAFAEIPAWQINPSWANSSNAWDEWTRPQLDDMIRFYGNFSSIVCWSAANEMGGAAEYNRRAIEFISKTDPSRIPTVVVDSNYHPNVFDQVPFAGRNLHYGLYHSKRVYDGLRKGLADNLRHADKRGIPLWVAELGGKAWRGRFAGAYNDERRDNEFHSDKNTRFGFQHCATSSESVCGISVWTWSDFHSRGGGVCNHGIFDISREPKLVSYTVRNLMEGKLRIFLCEDDSTCTPGSVFRAKAHLFNPDRISPGGAMKLRWLIQKGVSTLAEGEMPVPGSSLRSSELGEISWKIPSDADGFHSLWAELLDENGRQLHCNAVHFGAGKVESPGVISLSVEADGSSIAAHADFGWMKIPVYKNPGLIIPLSQGDYEFTVVLDGKSKRTTASVKAGQGTMIVEKF